MPYLQSELVLQWLLARLPSSIRTSDDITQNVHALFQHFSQVNKSTEAFTFFALVGMILPELSGRRRFLETLAKWDFHTFCSCLTRIPPTGNFTTCDQMFLLAFAEALSDWYYLLSEKHFSVNAQAVDPWFRIPRSGTAKLGVEIYVSSGCREVSYEYKVREAGETKVVVKLVPSYPTIGLELVSEQTRFRVHDPDNGIALRTFPIPGGGIRRIVNFTLPPFPGLSLNVPERIALFDLYSEILSLIERGRLWHTPTLLFVEQAWSLAHSIPGINSVEGLTLAVLEEQEENILSQFGEDSPMYIEAQDKLGNLKRLLSLIERPIDSTNLPQSKLGRNTIQSCSDEILQTYLIQIIALACQLYKLIVETNFPNIAPMFNLYAQLPCSIIILTNRKVVRYAIIPIEDDNVETYQVFSKVIDISETTPFDPEQKLFLRVNSEDVGVLEDHIQQMLNELGKTRPPISPIHTIEPFETFFTGTPVTDLVTNWLQADLTSIFGF